MLEQSTAHFYCPIEDAEAYATSSMRGDTISFMELSPDAALERLSFSNLLTYSEEKAAIYQNTILLMPAAYTVSMIDQRFWNCLAKRLIQEGYQVFSNYNAKPQEYVVEETLPFHSGLKEIVDLSRYFKAFIGLRSGLCDLIAETNATLVVVFPNEEGKRKHEMDDLFALRETSEGLWGVTCNKEYDWIDEAIEEIVRIINR